MTERLGREADPLIDALLAPIRALLDLYVEEKRDLDGFRQALIDLYPDLDDRDFADLMAQALAVAEAGGRLDASE